MFLLFTYEKGKRLNFLAILMEYSGSMDALYPSRILDIKSINSKRIKNAENE